MSPPRRAKDVTNEQILLRPGNLTGAESGKRKGTNRERLSRV